MSAFDEMADRFTARVEEAADWRNRYFGAAYSTRIKAAIANLREAIAEAERNPEIGTNKAQRFSNQSNSQLDY